MSKAIGRKEIQVVPKKTYTAYEIDVQNMMNACKKRNNEEKIEIEQSEIFGSDFDEEDSTEQNQGKVDQKEKVEYNPHRIKRTDCIALSQLIQLEPERNKKAIRDIIFVKANSECWGNGAGQEFLKKLIKKGFALTGTKNGKVKYVKFEESASMAKEGRMSFIRKELYNEMEERITLGFQAPLYKGDQMGNVIPWVSDSNSKGPILAKWHAYKGLAMSSGWNVNELFEKLNKKREIQQKIELNAENVVIVNDWKYEQDKKNKKDKKDKFVWPEHWTNTIDKNRNKNDTEVLYPIDKIPEGRDDLDLECSDGEGLISEEFGKYLEQLLLQIGETEKYEGENLSSFQIRLPFIKGMVHRVDFKQYFHDNNIAKIQDAYGKKHDVDNIEMILTVSMFKAWKWLEIKLKKTPETEPWKYYWDQIKKYNHSLYISQRNNTNEIVDEENNTYTYLNYQVLHTIGFSPKEIMELANEGLSNCKKYDDNELLKEEKLHFIQQACDEEMADDHAERIDEQEEQVQYSYDLMRKAIEIDPQFKQTEGIKKMIKDASDKVVKEAQEGRFLVKGTTRYLSTDLFGFLQYIGNNYGRNRRGGKVAIKNNLPRLGKDEFYAPGFIGLNPDKEYGISRNPHIAQNEHALLKSLRIEVESQPVEEEMKKRKILPYYKKYFGKLTGVLMVSPEGLAAERMGGADFDGDLVRLIDNDIYNTALREKVYRRTSQGTVENTLPLIKITKDEVNIEDWSKNYREKEYELCKSIIKNRVGLFSNQAFRLGCRAYGFCDDNTEEYKEKTLKFTIYTGLELDSVKTGVRPKVEKTDSKGAKLKNPFLQFKNGTSMNKIDYYAELSKNVKQVIKEKKKRKNELQDKGKDQLLEESIEEVIDNTKEIQSAVLLLPYYVKEKTKLLRSEERKNTDNKIQKENYIFQKMYKIVSESVHSKDMNDKDVENDKNTKLNKLCRAMECIQRGLSDANQRSYGNERTFGSYGMYDKDKISEILFNQHSVEVAEASVQILENYIAGIDWSKLKMDDINKAIAGLLAEYFELTVDKEKRKMLIEKYFKTINDANDNNDLDECENALTDLFCNFLYRGYQLAYRMLNKIKKQKTIVIRQQLNDVLKNSDESLNLQSDEEIWEYVQNYVNEYNDLNEQKEDSGESQNYLEIEYCKETVSIAREILTDKRLIRKRKNLQNKLKELFKNLSYTQIRKLEEEMEEENNINVKTWLEERMVAYEVDNKNAMTKVEDAYNALKKIEARAHIEENEIEFYLIVTDNEMDNEKKGDDLSMYYGDRLSACQGAGEREKEARRFLDDVIDLLNIDGDREKLILRIGLEYWHKQTARKDLANAECFLWKVAGKELIELAEKLVKSEKELEVRNA